jgi:hypothetical protein
LPNGRTESKVAFYYTVPYLFPLIRASFGLKSQRASFGEPL